MTARLLKGAELADSMRQRIDALIIDLIRRGGRPPVLGTMLVGDNASALAYRASIVRTFGRLAKPLVVSTHQLQQTGVRDFWALEQI